MFYSRGFREGEVLYGKGMPRLALLCSVTLVWQWLLNLDFTSSGSGHQSCWGGDFYVHKSGSPVALCLENTMACVELGARR